LTPGDLLFCYDIYLVKLVLDWILVMLAICI
jgi:hypothetical protein